MQIFTTLEQSKRLRDAGFPQTGSYTTIWDGPMEENMGQNIARPTVGELMEELKNDIDELYWDGEVWTVLLKPYEIAKHHQGQDESLISALVEAYCKRCEKHVPIMTLSEIAQAENNKDKDSDL
jgi:hypothetical protein